MTDSELNAAWDRVNEAGMGEVIGAEEDNPSEALSRAGYTDIRIYATYSDTTGGAAGIKGGRIMAVVDIYGPWGCDITPESA